MRLSHSDLIPLLVIMGSGAVGVVSSAALVLWMSPALASAPVPAIVEAAPTAAAPLRESAAPVRVVFSVRAPVPDVSESARHAWPGPAPVRLVWTSDGGKIVVLCRENDADRSRSGRMGPQEPPGLRAVLGAGAFKPATGRLQSGDRKSLFRSIGG